MAKKKDTEEPKGKEEKKPSQLMLIMDALFRDKDYIFNLTKEMAKQNIFMVLRRIAIKYPIEANVFNDGKVNALDTIKFWSDFLYCGFTPRWIYTSGAAKSQKLKSSVTKDQIKLYKKHYEITDKDFDDAMRFFPEQTINEITEISDFYGQIEKLRKENA